MAEKSYRIRTEVGRDKVIKASLTQDINFLEVLSLKINQEDTYKLHVSNYGIIVGRVLGNEAFGIPNARVSVFIKLKDDDIERSEIINLYPYRTIMTKDNENRRYNLLADSANDDCHRIVGTFPNKRLVLDNETEIEIYEKYWKYTTVTNQSGDFMIFGVPTGNHTIHVDIDLSDIGILSQKPRDFFYKGYNKEQFDSSEQFKDGKDLDSLTQLLSQNTSVYVYPFFGDANINDISITRCDVQIPYKFEPTCVFFGSIISDRKGEHINHKCGPTRWIGYNGRMVTGEGTIEMIRKTPDGLVEEFPIKGNHLIDGDGVWCYQIPMNLDYIGTDEFGNIIPVQDSTKGIPTRTSVRFRISMQETVTQTSTQHIAKYLVPNVHELNPESNHPQILKGNAYQGCYEFGSATPQEYFRDLLWNKVYSIKNYIPRFEQKNWLERVLGTGEKGYSGVRSVSSQHNHNVFPFNNARFHLKFTYRILCILMSIVVAIIKLWNSFVANAICWSFKILGYRIYPFKFLSKWIHCIGLEGGMFFEERSDIYYAPGCTKTCGGVLKKKPQGLRLETDDDDLLDLIQQTLALEYEIVNLDFYNDWINGTLYMPLWFWKKRAKKKYLFGLFSRSAVNTFCSCDKKYGNLSLSQPCSTIYNADFMPLNALNNNDERHYDFDTRSLKFGVIKEFTNRDGLKIYYYAPGVPYDINYRSNEGVTNYTQLFATDIILLGSLNSCDLDNLPKTFDSLPSTTVNLPFIATLDGDESGDGVITGLDWGHEGDTSNGLLMDLTCWNIYTRYKSCVNLSRLSELYVTFDMDITSDDDNEPSIRHDGVISDKELVENETRAKFASMNHNGLENLTVNSTTNYNTYKFHYIYPVNFNGHLDGVSLNKTQTITDIRDSNYVMYRLGEGKDSKNNIRHKKHFYNGTENKFNFPLYNNSFYFYFGLNEGKTAIEKFNSMFNASCTKRNKYGFTIDYVSKPGKWCYDTAKPQTDFGTIDIEFEGLTDTFSYSLYNEFNELLINEDNIKSSDLRFGYKIQPNGGGYVYTDKGYVKNGRLCRFQDGVEIKNIFNKPIYLENGIYFLEVINEFGMKVTQRINMIQNTLSPNIESVKLGTKFNSATTKRENICGDMDYYGEIRIKSFIIDGVEAFITDNIDEYFVDGESDTKPKEVTCKVTCTDGSEVYLILKPEGDETQDIDNFVCYGEGQVPSVRLETLGEGIYTLIFNIWKPGDYVLTTNQICQNVMNDNVSVNKISIENGDRFQVFVNGIPLDFINNNYFKGIGDSDDDEIFLPSTLISNDKFPRVWLQIENPKIYDFPSTLNSDFAVWDEYLNIVQEKYVDENGDTKEWIGRESKMEILRMQLEIIAKMRDISYIYGEANYPQISFTTKGGKEPILMRNIYPNYAVIEDENDICTKIIISNNNSIEAPINYPHIIGKRYQNTSAWNKNALGVRLNDVIYGAIISNNNNKIILGNYFAAFTNNGGFISLNDGTLKYNGKIYSEAIPVNANALNGLNISSSFEVSSYPIAVQNDYLRTLFLDKRVYADGNMFLPIKCDYEIYEDDNYEWKKGWWGITIYNTAPMVYDNEYNIIGNNLSYEIKKVVNSEITITISGYSRDSVITMGFEDGFRIENKKMKQLRYSGTNIDESARYFTNRILNLYDNVLTNLTISGNTEGEIIKWVLKYHQLKQVNNIEDLNDDSDIRLTSNLMWYSDLGDIQDNKAVARNQNRLYKCSMDIDGFEIDYRSDFYALNYGSETDSTSKQYDYVSIMKPHQNDGKIKFDYGEILTFTMANTKMKGNLDYYIKTEGEKENTYEFKSHIEGADETILKYNIGNRVNLKSGALLYQSMNSGRYVMWEGQRFYLDEKTYKKYYCYIEDIKNTYDIMTDNIGNYVVEYEGEEKRLSANTNNIPILTISGSSIVGYYWVRRQCLNLNLNSLNELLNTLTMQDVLNKYGVNYYTCMYGATLYYTFDPLVSGNTVSIYKFSGITTPHSSVEHYFDYYYYYNQNIAYIHILTNEEYFRCAGNSPTMCHEKNGYFYVQNQTSEQSTITLPILCTKKDIEGEDDIVTLEYNNIVTYEIDNIFYSTASTFNKSNAYESVEMEDNKEFNGDTSVYIMEKNPLDNKWYFRKKDENIYSAFTQFIKYGENIVLFDESIHVVENNMINILVPTSVKVSASTINTIPLINNQCWYNVTLDYRIINDGTQIQIIDKILDINETSFNQYEIQYIDDFSCSIVKDEVNDNYDKIETTVPFLSASIIRNYSLPQTTYSFHGNTASPDTTIPLWVSGNTSGGRQNIVLFKTVDWCLYQNQYYKTKRDNQNNSALVQNLPINEIKIENIGETSFYQGMTKIQNIFQENIDYTKIKYYTNCNVPKMTFLFNDVQEGVDKNNDKILDNRYRISSPIIGEMLPYLRRTIVNELEDDSERIYYFAKGQSGKDYGNYFQMPVKNWFRKDYYNFYEISSSGKTSWVQMSIAQQNRMGIGVIQSFVKESETSSLKEIYESSDLYNDMIYVYQPNTKEEIKRGTEIISCNFVKTYYDSNTNFNYKVTPMFNQSYNFHVGKMYFGNVIQNSEKYIIPLFFPKLSNQDIQKALSSTIKCYMGGITTKIESLTNENIFGNIAYLYNTVLSASTTEIDISGIDAKLWTNRIDFIENTKFDIVVNNKNKKGYIVNPTSVKLIGINRSISFKNEPIILGIRKKEVSSQSNTDVSRIAKLVFTCEYGKSINQMGTTFKRSYFYYDKVKNGFKIENYTKIGNLQFKLNTDTIITNAICEINDKETSESPKFIFSNSIMTDNLSGSIEINLSSSTSEIQNGQYKPISNIWKKDDNDYLHPFSSEVLVSLESIYDNNGTTEDFFRAVLSAMCEDYNFSSKTKINLDDLNDVNNFGTVWDKLQNNYMITMKLDKKVCFYKNKIYFETKTNIIEINDKDYTIIYNSGIGYYIEIEGLQFIPSIDFNGLEEKSVQRPEEDTSTSTQKNKIKYQVYDFIIINDMFVNSTFTGNNDNYEVVYYDKFNSDVPIKVQDYFDVQDFCDRFSFNRTFDNQYTLYGKKSSIDLENDSAFKLMEDISKLDLDSTKVIKIFDMRYNGNTLVKVLSNNNNTITYTNPFDNSKKIQCDIRQYYNYGSDGIFSSDLKSKNGIDENDWVRFNSYIGVLDITQMVEIECSDGYIFVGLSTEELTIINQEGKKENKYFMDLLNTNVQSQYIYHLEKIDDIWFNFASPIQNIREIKSNYVISLNKDDVQNKLKSNHNYVLSIEVNKMIHKFPFIYNNKMFKPL